MQPRRLVVLAAVVALAGCGGNSDRQTTGVGDEFAANALEMCQKALEDKQEWSRFPVAGFDPSVPDPAKLPAVATWLTNEVAPTFHMWLSSLQALGTPPSAEEDWNAMLAAIEEIDQLNSDQITAAKAHDPAAFAAATADLQSIQSELVATSNRAGVPDCADVHAA